MLLLPNPIRFWNSKNLAIFLSCLFSSSFTSFPSSATPLDDAQKAVQRVTATQLSVPSQMTVYRYTVIEDIRRYEASLDPNTGKPLPQLKPASSDGRVAPLWDAEAQRPFTAYQLKYPSDPKVAAKDIMTSSQTYADQIRALRTEHDNTKYWIEVHQKMANNTAYSAAVGGAAFAGPTVGASVIPGAVITVGAASYEYGASVYGDYAQRKYEENLAQLSDGLWAELKQRNPESYDRTKQLLESTSAEDQHAAFQELVGGRADLFKETPLSDMSSAELMRQAPRLFELLKEGQQNERILSKNELDKLTKRVVDGEKAVSTFSNNIKSLSLQIEATSSSVTRLDGKVKELKSSVQVTNALLYSRMSPVEKLQALEQGLDVGLEPGQVKAEIESLQSKVTEILRIQDIQQLQQTGNEVAAVAKSSLAIAEAVGIDIPPEVSQAITMSEAAFNVGTSFAMGPMAGVVALGGAASLFGKKSSPQSDPRVLKALAEIKQQLDQVMILQQETNDRLKAIDLKLSEQHQEVMDKLVEINEKVGFLVDDVVFDYQKGLATCDTFARKQKETALNASTNSLYEELAQSYNTDSSVSEAFKQCDSFLREALAIANEGVNPLLQRGLKRTAEKTLFDQNRLLYSPVLELAKRHGPQSGSQWCRGYINLLTAMTLTTDQAAIDVCEPNAARFTFASSGEPLNNNASAMESYIYHDEPDNTGQSHFYRLWSALSTVAPYYELMKPGAFDAIRSLEEISKPGAKPVNASVAPDRYANLLDLMALAAAQESLMAGVGLLSPLSKSVNAVLAGGAGNNAARRWIADDLVSDGKALGTVGNDDITKAFNTSCNLGVPVLDGPRLRCLFERHPQLLRNVLIHQLRMAITKSERFKTSPAVAWRFYQAGWEVGSLEIMNAVTTGAEAGITWVEDDAHQFGWVIRYPESSFKKSPETDELAHGAYFKFRRADGQLLYVLAPSRFEVERGQLHYRTSAYTLQDLRATALTESTLFRLRKKTDNHIGLSPTEASRNALRFAFASMPQRSDADAAAKQSLVEKSMK